MVVLQATRYVKAVNYYWLAVNHTQGFIIVSLAMIPNIL